MSFWKNLLGGDFESNRNTGDEHFESGRFGEAKLAYERALAKASGLEDGVAEALRDRIRRCRAALAEAQAERAVAAAQQGDLDAAIEGYESAIEVSEDPDARKRYRKCIDELHADEARAAVAAPGEATAEDRYEALSGTWEDEQFDEYERYGEAFRRACLGLHEGPVEELANNLEQLLELSRDFEDARYLYLEIGRAQLRLGQRDEGVASLRRFLSSLPESSGEISRVHAHFALAETYLEGDDESSAEQELRLAAASMPELTEAHLRLGQFLRARGRFEEARASLDEAARTMGEVHPDERVIREIGLTQIGLGRQGEALETLENVMQMRAARGSLDFDPPAAIALAKLYEERGDPNRAADQYRHLARGSDVANHFVYHREAARLLIAAGKRQQAHEYVVKARELAPDDESRATVDAIEPRE